MIFTQRLDLIYQIFSPSAPIENIELFVGRYQVIKQVREGLEERGQHLIVYGGRGVGKTSLANIVNQMFQNVAVAKVTCNRHDDYQSLWRKALSRVTTYEAQSGIGYDAQDAARMVNFELPPEVLFEPAILEEHFSAIQSSLLFVFDEFDTITDQASQMQMADTIKTLSDNVPMVTIMLVGIGGNMSELIGEHPSLERCLKPICLPPMRDSEAGEIILNSLKILEMDIEQPVLRHIVDYACGFPHYVHLLCKFACKRAVSKNETTVSSKHLDWAVEQSILSSTQSLQEAYDQAIKSAAHRKNQFQDVALACTQSSTDERNSFNSHEVLAAFNQLTNKDNRVEAINYNLGMLCKAERGNILEKVRGDRQTRYRFRNPLMKAFIKLQTHQNKQS